MTSESNGSSVTASQLMRRKVPTLRKKTSVLEAVELMLKEALHHIPIVDKKDHVVGMVSRTDLRNAVGDLRDAVERGRPRLARMADTKLSKLMTRDPVVVGPDAVLAEMASVMTDRGVRALVVVDGEGLLLGLVLDVDLLGQIAGAPRAMRHRARRDGGSDGIGASA